MSEWDAFPLAEQSGGGWDAFPLAPKPNVGLDIAKQTGAGLVRGVEQIAGAAPSLLGLAGKGLNYLAPGLFDQGKTAQQEDLRRQIQAIGGGSVEKYLPKAETSLGEAAGNVASFIPSALTLPGGTARNVATGVASGAGSELAGKVAEGTPYETAARLGGALAGGHVALKAADSLAASRAISALPKLSEVEEASTKGYDAARDAAMRVPTTEQQTTALIDGIKADLHAKNFRPANVEAVYQELDKLPKAGDAADFVNLYKGLGKMRGEEGVAARSIAMPTIEAEMNRVVPGLGQTLKDANANYNVFKVTQGLDKRAAKAELQTAGTASGTNLGNKLRQAAATAATSGRDLRFMKPGDIAALENVSRGTFLQNRLRDVGNLLGGGVGIGGIGAAALSGEYLGGHEGGGTAGLAALALGRGSRALYNRAVANAAARVQPQIIARSPYAASLGATGPAPPLSHTKASLLAALYAAPAMRGILPYKAKDQEERR